METYIAASGEHEKWCENLKNLHNINMKNNYCIYMIENKINKKIYIGQTYNFEKRVKEHKRTAYNKNNICYNYPLYKDIREYGIENFDFKIIEKDIETKKTLNEKEFIYIEKYNSTDPLIGYNLRCGGNVQKGIYNVAYGKTGSKSCHAKKVIDLNTNIVYDSLIDCALELFCDKKYMKCISNVCNPKINKFEFRGHEFRLVNSDGSIVEKEIKKSKSGKLIKEINTGIIKRGISNMAKIFGVSEKVIGKRINNQMKIKTEFDKYFKFNEIEEGNETEINDQQIKKINEIMSKIDIHKIVN